jgi:hypothetical protein
LAAVAVAAACGGDDRPTRTNIQQVDAVIEAVQAQDRDRLRDLLQFTSVPCADSTGTGGPPRCQGEPAGTNVEVFQANQCEAQWLRRAGTDGLLEEVVALKPELYAAFETPDAFYLEGRYAVVFEGDDPRIDEQGLKRYMAVGVEADNGLITGIALGCGIDEPVHFLLPHQDSGFDDWLIEPPE